MSPLRLDARDRHFHFLNAGMPAEPSAFASRFDSYLFMKYRIRRFFSQDCSGSPQYYQLIRTYNTAMEAEVRKAYGKSYHDILTEANDAINQQRRQQLIGSGLTAVGQGLP